MTSKSLAWVAVIVTIAALAVPNIFAIGDVVGQPMLAHKAVHEGKVAAEVTAGHNRHFDARIIPSVERALSMRPNTGRPCMHCPYLCSSCRRQARLLN